MSGRLLVYSRTQVVSTRTPQLAEVLDRVEERCVAELAGKAHRDGFRFLGWPRVTRAWVPDWCADPEKELPEGDPAAQYVWVHLEVVGEER